MSPEYQGEPVPSMMWPLRMIRSYGCAEAPSARRRRNAKFFKSDPLLVGPRYELQVDVADRLKFTSVLMVIKFVGSEFHTVDCDLNVPLESNHSQWFDIF